MKKIFTLISAALISFVVAQAETVTCYVYNWSWKSAGKSFTADLTLDGNGVYTLTPFWGSDEPIKFTVGEYGDVNTDYNCRYANITFENVELEDGDDAPYLLTADGSDYMTCLNINTDGSETTVGWPYVYEDGYSYITEYLNYVEENLYQFDGTICVNGFDTSTNKSLSGYYIYFCFDALDAGVESVVADADATVEYFNLQGIKVNNPTAGLYIRRCGKKVDKVVVR